jgi:hypothetical protein
MAHLGILTKRANELLSNNIRNKTQGIYNGVVRRYIQFCASHRIVALPPSVASVRLWMANLSLSCVSPTVNNYVSALGHFCRSRGIPWDHIRADHQIVGSLKGLRYLKPGANRAKSPLSTENMNAIFSRLDLDKHDDIVFWSATVIGFFGLFRLGELAHHPDARHRDNGTFVYLPGSKTDQEFRGAWILLPKLPDRWCPSTAAKHLESRIAGGDTPLFTLSHGLQMNKAWFMRRLQQLLPDAPELTGHSLRVGGATWAAKMGFTHDDIKLLGRWSSEAFRVYLKHQPKLAFILQRSPWTQHLASLRTLDPCRSRSS